MVWRSRGHHVRLAAPGLAQKGDLVARSARASTRSSARAGKYAEALPLAQAMVDLAREVPATTAISPRRCNNLGQIYADQGRDDPAEPLYKRAIALMEKGPASTAPRSRRLLVNLAALVSAAGAASPKPSRCSSARSPFARRRCRASIPMSASRSTISPRST